MSASTIHVRIDSDGGDIFAARSMKTAIMQHKAHMIAHIDGLAASSASFVAMGADEIEIVEGGFLMMHNALSLLDIIELYKDLFFKLLVIVKYEFKFRNNFYKFFNFIFNFILLKGCKAL